MPHKQSQLHSAGAPVAFFASAYYPSVGGVQEVVRQLARRQSQQGAPPIVFTNRWPKDLPEESDHEGIPVRRYVFRVPEHNVKQMAGAVLYAMPTLAAIRGHMKRAGCRIINVHCVSSNAYYALLAKRATGLPLVLSLHGELTVDSTGLFQRSRFAQNLLRSALDSADAITACSAKSLAEAEEFYGRPFGKRASVVYSGVDVAELQGAAPYPHPRPYILAIGRLERPKGFDVLIAAFHRIAVANPSVDLIVAGVGSEMDALQRQAQELGLANRVVFPGRVDRPTVASLFASCLYFVLPSRVEPMGIVNLEAMSAGKAVVASNVGGVSELVRDGETGLLTSPENGEALAAAMQRLLTDSVLRDALGAAGRERVGLFDWAVSAAKFQKIYDDLTGRPMSGELAGARSN